MGMSKPKNITGQRFGRLTVLDQLGKTSGGNLRWNCLCDCGRSKNVAAGNLQSGHVASCGCLHAERKAARSFKHGQAIKGKETPEYRAWHGMKFRCSPRNKKDWIYYAGSGITVCPEWENDFNAFYDHIGQRPSNEHSLDRIDVTKGYQHGNVRWATRTEQSRNRRSVKNLLLKLAGM